MAGDWHDLDDGGRYSIAGWQTVSSSWHDVEKGDRSFEDSPFDAHDLEQVVFHYVDEQGNDLYLTVYGPWDDMEGFEDIIADMLDRYGVGDG